MNLNFGETYPVFIGVVFAVSLLLLIIRFAISQSRPPELPVLVQAGSLRIDGNRYGGPIPLGHLKLEEAKTVDPRTDDSLWPVTGFPQTSPVRTDISSRQSGWFTLRNGEKALVFISPNTKAAYIPTTSDYVVLVSVDDPDELIASLRLSTSATNLA